MHKGFLGGNNVIYENELKFLCDTFKKCNLRTTITTLSESLSDISLSDINSIINTDVGKNMHIGDFLGKLDACTVYKKKDENQCRYIYFLLSPSQASPLLIIGPYLSSPLSSRNTLEIGERLGISPKNQKYLDEYFSGLPIIPENSPLLIMLDTFCERIWGSPSFSIIDTSPGNKPPTPPISESSRDDDFDDVLINIKVLEKRYSFENEIIRAVTLGQLHKENLLLSAVNDQPFEARLTDPIRNAKNYGIIMNTLLRKAAENGGVHPVHLDKISSSFAQKIEQVSSLSDSATLMHDMFRSYCRLVRKHTVQKYSPVVQKAILMIDSDLSADLTLSSLAQNQNISSPYLSATFKKETGSTISEYIRSRRMDHASHLLATTHLQIQTVALHCGIMDVQYFSKLFKKHTGKTPKEYREAAKASNIALKN